jgi:hypothetical protein
LPGMPWYLGIHTIVALLSSVNVPVTCKHSQTKADVVLISQVSLKMPNYQSRSVFFSS